MKSVFIGGSRRISRMNKEIARRLQNIIDNQLRVLVGDTNGFDRVAQAFFAEKGYSLVVVYCTAGKCRNNVGGWPVEAVEYEGRGGGREFYTAKDDAMLREADYGFFAWDGESKGTLRNISKMAELGKPSVVYLSTTKTFVNVRKPQDVSTLSQDGPVGVESSDLFSDLIGAEVENRQAS